MRPYAERWREYLEVGFVPLPTAMTGKGAGKAPAMKWEAYQEKQPAMGEYERFESLHGDANIGTLTGAVSGVFVLDFDRKKENEPKELIDGVDYFQTVKGILPRTPVARTGGGGYHVFFRHPGGKVPNRVRAARQACVDIRGDGGFIVLPPSRKIGGGTYEWLPGLSPFEVDLADPPGWVTDMFGRKARQDEEKRDVIPEGYRNDTLFRVACSLRNQGFDETYILDQLRITNRVNAQRGQKLLDDRELQTLARQGAKYDVPKWKKDKADEEVEKVLTLPGMDVFIEEVRTPGGLRLLVKDDTGITEHERYGMFVPDDHSVIAEEYLLLPSGADAYGTPTALWEELRAFIHRYVDLGSERYERLYAAYAMLSWLFPEMPVLPMASVVGPMGVAKTRALDVLGGVCYHTCTMVFPTEPVLYRTIGRLHPTICFEEQTVAVSDREQPFIRVLNAGLQKGARVPRCSGEDYEPKFYDIFCPKVVARHEYYDDPAFESRCITCRLSETIRTDIPIVLPPAFYREREALMRKLLMWRFDYLYKVAWDVNGRLAEIRKKTGVSFRTLQVYSSLLALGALVDGLEETLLEHFSTADEQVRDQKTDSATGIVVQALVRILRRKMGEGTYLQGVRDIRDAVVTPGEVKAELEEYGSDFTTTRVSRILKPLGIVSKPRRVDGNSGSIRCYALTPELVAKAQEGYLDEALHIEIQEVSQSVTETGKEGSVTLVTLSGGTGAIPKKMNKIDTGMYNSGYTRGGAPPSAKCNRQSVTENVTQSVTGKKAPKKGENQGVEEDTLDDLRVPCAKCLEPFDASDVEPIQGRYYCPACQDAMHREYLGRSGAKASGEG